MSVRKDFIDGQIITCDECGEEVVTGEPDFKLAIQVFRAQGGRVQKDEATGRWHHHCSGCVEDGV